MYFRLALLRKQQNWVSTSCWVLLSV